MAGRKFLFDPPDRFVAGAVGPPGRRAFYLQAAKGGAVLSVGLEKVEVALLAERIGELMEALTRRGVPIPAASWEAREGVTFEEPHGEAFRVASLTITYDDAGGDVTVEAHGLGEPADAAGAADEERERADLLRVRLSLGEARLFAERAMAVVAAGRPPCPLCGEPLEPQGHICLRRNGYVM